MGDQHLSIEALITQAQLPSQVLLNQPLSLRDSTTIQCGIKPDSLLLLPLPRSIPASALMSVLQEARIPVETHRIISSLTLCRIDPSSAIALLGELLHAQVLHPCAIQSWFIISEDVELRTKLSTELERYGHKTKAQSSLQPSQLAHCTDIVIFLDILIPPIETILSCMSHGIPHLSARIMDQKIIIGPLIMPGLNPCLLCWEEYYRRCDKQWPLLRSRMRAYAHSSTANAAAHCTMPMNPQNKELLIHLLTPLLVQYSRHHSMGQSYRKEELSITKRQLIYDPYQGAISQHIAPQWKECPGCSCVSTMSGQGQSL